MRRRFTAEERQRFVDEVRTTGASVKDAAARLGLDSSIGYRWMQAARQAGAPKFARLVVSGSRTPGAIAIEVGGAVVRVEAGFDSELLRAVVSSLSAASK
jgi:transposase-like protein